MSRRRRGGSTLHLQMGQETIYLLLTGGLFVSLLLSLYILSRRGPTEQPPIVTLAEANGYSFPAGSAAVSPAFARQLRSVAAPRVREIADRYAAPVIEVIGHTDEVPVTRVKQSDLDRSLIPWLRGGGEEPVAGDNVGLGMARARRGWTRATRSSRCPPGRWCCRATASPTEPTPPMTDVAAGSSCGFEGRTGGEVSQSSPEGGGGSCVAWWRGTCARRYRIRAATYPSTTRFASGPPPPPGQE